MNLVKWSPIVVLVALVVGCTSGPQSDKGTLVGTVLISGGPSPSLSTPRPFANQPIRVLGPGFKVVATGVTASDGTYRFSLPSGVYSVEVPCSGLGIDATVASGQTFHASAVTCEAS